MSTNDLKAIELLYEQHAHAVHAYALRRSNRETAEEVTARVFLVAWRRRESIPAEALPWLYGVARRVLAEERRGATRRGALSSRLSSGVANEAEQVSEATTDTTLAAALAQLSSLDREALLLRYWEELSPEQVAQVLGCSRATLAVRLHRARRRLRQLLAAQRDTEHICVAGAGS